MTNWLFAVKSFGHTPDMYDPGTYGSHVPLHKQKHGLVFACYQRLLKIRNLMDFDDHLSKACLPLALVSDGTLSHAGNDVLQRVMP